MEASRDEVISAIKRVGGEKDLSRHLNYRIYVDEKFIGKVSIGHGWKKRGSKRLGKVAGQMYLSPRQLYDLCTGEKDLDWYRRYLKEIGRL